MLNIKEPKIALVHNAEADVSIRFPDDTATRDNVWLAVDLGAGRPEALVNLIRTDEGIVIDVHRRSTADRDGDDTITASTWVLDADLGTDLG